MPRWRYCSNDLLLFISFSKFWSRNQTLSYPFGFISLKIYIYILVFDFLPRIRSLESRYKKKNSNSQIHKNRNCSNSSTQSIHWPAINFNKIPLDPLENVLLNTPRPLVSTRWCDNVRNNISIYPLDVGEAASIRISIAAPDVIALHRGEISSFGTRNLGRKRTSFVRAPDRGDPPRAKEGSEIRLENRPARV